MRFRFGADVGLVREHGGTVIIIDRGQEIEGDALLVALGRRPVVEGLDLEPAGVKYSERGIEVDEHRRSSQKHIYACGDVIGSFQFTHYAAWQASIAVRTMLFPACAFFSDCDQMRIEPQGGGGLNWRNGAGTQPFCGPVGVSA